ncbi:MAG TPA: DNA-3-methyladenine glycosylase [Verrucomicrobiae bacterium]|nr:DNA-3-methyladenine glycosylase [Verrucomicrobiae bacterium]
MDIAAFQKEFQLGVAHLKHHDPILGAHIATGPMPTLTPHTNYYQDLVSAIIGQQLSVKAAAAIKKRFLDLFDGAFPTPDMILTKDITTLKSVGLSLPKAKYIQDLARRIIDGTVRFDTLDAMTDQEIIAVLTEVKGIGEWTVHMFLMFCMGRLDVLPVGDLGIRNSIKRLYNLETLPSPTVINELADKNGWHPYCSIAALYLWQGLDNMPK